MKKIILAIALVMTLSFGASAQADGFVADWTTNDMFRDGGFSALPGITFDHGLSVDQPAPLGSGLLLLTALGAGYAVARRKKDK